MAHYSAYMDEVGENLPNLYQPAETSNHDLTFDEDDKLFGR